MKIDLAVVFILTVFMAASGFCSYAAMMLIYKLLEVFA
jgi:hypothetical protein